MNIPYTPEMTELVLKGCDSRGITRAQAAREIGRHKTYFYHKHKTITQKTWDKIVAFFKNETMAAPAKTSSHEAVQRLREMANEPGASGPHLAGLFNISKSTVFRIKQGENVKPAVLKLIEAGFKRLDASTQELATPKPAVRVKAVKAAKPQPKAALKTPSVIVTVAEAFRLHTELKALLQGLPAPERQELMDVLFRPTVP